MSIETLLSDLIAAVNANTAALGGKASAASTATASTDAGAATKGTRGKGKTGDAAEAKKSGPTREEMTAALTEVKDRFGAAEAKAIIQKVGAAKMVDIAEDKIEAAFKLAKAKLEADEADADDGGEL